MNTPPFDDRAAAIALTRILGSSRWEIVTLAHGFQNVQNGATEDAAAREMFEQGGLTLKRCRELLGKALREGFLTVLPLREKRGSAENPITKLFPATITEQRFIESLDSLHTQRPGVSYKDDREVGHTLTDFRLIENDAVLPINIKNAGTRFERAQQLVGLAPDDCIPIPAYKAHAAIQTVPDLLYVVSADYCLVGKLNERLPQLLEQDESIVWRMLNDFSGSRLREAEDTFIFVMVRKYWESLRGLCEENPFHVISARKAIRVLQTKPQRTPGIGLRAWGTGASAEVNVHVSVQDDMTPWERVFSRVAEKGIGDIIQAVNRKRTEVVYDPEI